MCSHPSSDLRPSHPKNPEDPQAGKRPPKKKRSAEQILRRDLPRRSGTQKLRVPHKLLLALGIEPPRTVG
eukprot:CAMPEP_0113958108 /NCGR_PEP_ID=MMETSP0011_2-20120614/3166_1 /TAXON_ID=101924 /ORGANISM="Rhodosorus marinus" /LENGTH=69 /DNA_ID=CAMNT_0000968793 /DNA_START=99 /DNA_END=304 /DNA_ORIENTATION=+ /assembly_acc=CAM_ASM_000156